MEIRYIKIYSIHVQGPFSIRKIIICWKPHKWTQYCFSASFRALNLSQVSQPKSLKNSTQDQTKMKTFNPLNMWWWSCISAHSHFQHEEGGRKKGEKQMFTECICECWHLLTTHCSLDPLSWDCCWLKSQQLALLTVYYGQHTYETQL